MADSQPRNDDDLPYTCSHLLPCFLFRSRSPYRSRGFSTNGKGRLILSATHTHTSLARISTFSVRVYQVICIVEVFFSIVSHLECLRDRRSSRTHGRDSFDIIATANAVISIDHQAGQFTSERLVSQSATTNRFSVGYSTSGRLIVETGTSGSRCAWTVAVRGMFQVSDGLSPRVVYQGDQGEGKK